MNYSIDTTKYIDRMMAFCRMQGVILNLQNPVTIQDKLAWLNIYDVNPLKTKCADKIQLHDYSKEVLGEDICIPIIKVYNSTNEINWDELPQQFVLKCNHGSGMNIIVKDKSKLNKIESIGKLNHWMADDFAFRNGFEAHYHDIPHKIFAEEYKENSNNGLIDYKFWCFNGKPEFIHVVDDRYSGNMHFNFYSVDNFDKLDLAQTNHPASNYKLDPPKNLKTMVEYAKKLSKSFKFARVDFYEIDNEVYLGEITFTPDALVFKYKNPNDNIEVGKLLKL